MQVPAKYSVVCNDTRELMKNDARRVILFGIAHYHTDRLQKSRVNS